jgi:hypothetical protein
MVNRNGSRNRGGSSRGVSVSPDAKMDIVSVTRWAKSAKFSVIVQIAIILILFSYKLEKTKFFNKSSKLTISTLASISTILHFFLFDLLLI